jgi:hypothetical protein
MINAYKYLTSLTYFLFIQSINLITSKLLAIIIRVCSMQVIHLYSGHGPRGGSGKGWRGQSLSVANLKFGLRCKSLI